MNRIALASLASAALAAATLLTPVGLAAGDDPYAAYSAVGCQPYGSSPDGHRRLDGDILNQSTTSRGDYLCPIVRADELVFRHLGGVRTAAIVRVKDVHPSADVWCHLYARNANGTAFGWQAQRTSGVNSNVQELSLTAFQPSDGAAVLRCTLPPRHAELGASSIVSYLAY